MPGDGFPVFDLDFGRVGALVCWDNWFSESIKLAKRNGAELLLFPLAGCARDHVETVFSARAIDAGQGDPYELYYDESRPEIYEKFDWRQPRK